jgi:heavy metal sensor kinase
MKLTSVRMRLTLWNIGALALALTGFAVAVRYTAEVNLITAIDSDLAQQADRVAGRFARLDSLLPLASSNNANETRRIEQILKELRELQPLLPKPPQNPEPNPRDIRMLRVLDLNGHGMLPLPLFNLPPPRMSSMRGHHRRMIHPPLGIIQRLIEANAPLADRPLGTRLFTRAVAGETIYTTLTINGMNLRVLSRPLMRQGQIAGVIQAARPLTELHSLVGGLARTLLMLVPLALLAAGLVGAFLTERALRPVRQITVAAEALGAEDLAQRLPVTGGDEFAELASTFNRMIGRLETAFTRLEAAFEQQQRFTADASHELRTPLTTIKANTSLALRGQRNRQEYREALVAADRAADIMGRLVQDLLLLARSDSGQLELRRCPVNVMEMLDRALALVRRQPQHAPICLDVADPDLQVMGDADHLARLVLNLVENALRHTPPEGLIRVVAQAEGAQVALIVEDTGEGIPEEHLEHVIERFYRVDAARARAAGGTGLGLAICRSIVEAHQGTLTIHSVVGQGTTVTVLLPCGLLTEPSSFGTL